MKGIFVFLCSSIFLVLVGCTEDSSEKVSNELENKTKEQQASLEEYQDDLQKAEEKNRQLANELDTLKNDNEIKNSELQFKSNKINSLQALLQQTYEVMGNEIGENKAFKILGLFKPESITEDSQVGAVTVQNIKMEKQNKEIRRYRIDFNGELELTGTVRLDEAHGGYVFTVNNKHFNQVPHTMYDITNGTISFKIKNEEAFIEALGEDLSIGEIKSIHAVFKNYNSVYIAESHSSDYATFVEMISD
ncbi:MULTISPECIES: OmpH family outer membrane protein [Pontibacillus]|uniref:Uncharacterized protein n=1 Tax=Pontibacillus marinus BH030004 = DSM 16465 TaxID=1385511 RepID=A0A0A5FWF5_9BACI|nr:MULTISPECIES: OmpH family outer membrane protein [Pontibacillus]KGX83358.1 hypothetical protein N783_04330 [Pontibacillus marinus BH030004 = DSM 16465]QHE50876.1 hypothetical protein GS400_01940 [Pontibacillus sp. HMF3514]QHE52763.1 hypothetical protein GS400_12315 [Pontibacillus sp. HMF3514]